MAQEIYQKIKIHLDESVTNFIDVMSLESEKFITRKLSIDKIKNEYGSLDDYFKSLIKKGIEKVQVTLRKKRGTSSVPVGAGLNIGLNNEAAKETPSPSLPVSKPSPSSQTVMYSNASVESEILKYKNEDLREKLTDIKDRIADYKLKEKKQSKKIGLYENKIQKLKAKVHLFNKRKEIELKEIESSRKGFLESETGKELLQTGLSIAASLAAKGGTPPGLASASENEDISESKSALIQFINNDSVSDQDCAAVYYALVGLVDNNKEFTESLVKLLETHNLKNQNG